MQEDAYAPVPSTYDLLQRVKRPRKKTWADRVETGLFIGSAILMLIGLAIVVLGKSAWIPLDFAKALAAIFLVALVMLFVAWALTQLAEAIQAIRAGFRPAAANIDQAIERERDFILELQSCDPRELREKAKHYDLEAKLLVRRSGFSTVFAAIGVVALNLQGAGERAKFWGNLEYTSLLVYSGTLGLLIGSVILMVLISRLERVAGIFSLAAERLEES